VTRRLTLLLGAATVVAALDLLHKQQAISEQGRVVLLHDRPTRYVVAGAALSLGWAAAIALTRSSSIALFGGVVLGGAAGNLLCSPCGRPCRASRTRSSPEDWHSALATSPSSAASCCSLRLQSCSRGVTEGTCSHRRRAANHS
jgi:hypothetical protein